MILLSDLRNRTVHLSTWLSHLHPLLTRQGLEYQVFVVDQADSAPFNRGALLNVGFLEARKLDNFTCFVFHDVDMVPENDLMLYRCRESEQVSQRPSNRYLPTSELELFYWRS